MSWPKVKVEHLFSTPLMPLAWAERGDLNSALRELILDRRSQTPGEKMSNAGGWQSAKDLQKWDVKSTKDLMEMIKIGIALFVGECFGDAAPAILETCQIAAWANVNEFGHYNTLHNHNGAVCSGVYYVDAGSPAAELPLSGVLTFRNPTLAPLAIGNLPGEHRGQFCQAERSVVPRSGLMLLFPSWVEHYVHPYFGSSPRISVSWDVAF